MGHSRNALKAGRTIRRQEVDVDAAGLARHRQPGGMLLAPAMGECHRSWQQVAE